MRRFLLFLLFGCAAACRAQTAPAPSTPASPTPAPSASPHYHYAATWEMRQAEDVSFRPEGVATDTPGRLFVCAGRQGIAVYVNGVSEGYIGFVNPADARQAVDASGQPITGDTMADPIFRAHDPKNEPFVLIDGRQSMPIAGHLWKPVGVCALAGDVLAVVDNFTGYVQAFRTGRPAGSFEVPAPPGAHDDSASRFAGVAADGGDYIYVLDAHNGCVLKIRRRDSVLIRAIGAAPPAPPAPVTPSAAPTTAPALPTVSVVLPDVPAPAVPDGTLSAPVALALHPGKPEVYVADGGHSRVAVYGVKGNFLFAFGTKGTGEGQFSRMGGIAFGGEDRLFVADGDRVQVFTDQGRFLTQFGDVPGTKKGEGFAALIAAGGVAVDSAGTVYVADPVAYNVKVYKPDAR